MDRFLVWAVMLLTALPAGAHHSLSGTYDMGRQTTIEGVVREFRFVNPHPFVVVEVPAPRGGDLQIWQLELDNRYELTGIGITAQTFKAGDRVVVTGNPGRTEAHALSVTRLDRPSDGFRYEQIGTTPRVGRIPR
jgi:hypothetical protein